MTLRRVAAFAVTGAAGAVATLSCDVGIVGGGPGGVYAAMRIGNETDTRVCLFERGDRLGGRVLTLDGLGDHGDLRVDAGAYRFAREKTTAGSDSTCV